MIPCCKPCLHLRDTEVVQQTHSKMHNDHATGSNLRDAPFPNSTATNESPQPIPFSGIPAGCSSPPASWRVPAHRKIKVCQLHPRTSDMHGSSSSFHAAKKTLPPKPR